MFLLSFQWGLLECLAIPDPFGVALKIQVWLPSCLLHWSADFIWSQQTDLAVGQELRQFNLCPAAGSPNLQCQAGHSLIVCYIHTLLDAIHQLFEEFESLLLDFLRPPEDLSHIFHVLGIVGIQITEGCLVGYPRSLHLLPTLLCPVLNLTQLTNRTMVNAIIEQLQANQLVPSLSVNSYRQTVNAITISEQLQADSQCYLCYHRLVNGSLAACKPSPKTGITGC